MVALLCVSLVGCSSGSDASSAGGNGGAGGGGGAGSGSGAAAAAGVPGESSGGSATGGDGGSAGAGGETGTSGRGGGGGINGGGAAGSDVGGNGGVGGAACVPTDGSRLSVSNAEILDPQGNALLLRGWNWGEWGSVQPNDAADHRAQGANVVRVPLRWWGLYANQDASVDPKVRIDSRSDGSPGNIEPTHLALLDEMLDEAACQGLWIDFFLDSNCGQASGALDTAAYCGTGNDGKPASFANDPAAAELFTKTWEFLVTRYNTHPRIAMWEILPEPRLGCDASGCSDFGLAPAFYAPIIDRIRAIDPLTPILVGPDGGYEIKRIDTAYIPGKSGLIYTGNFLDGPAGHPEYVSFATDFRTAKNVPVFIQQVGSRKSDAMPDVRAKAILDALNGASIGWTWWTYRESRSPMGGGFAPYWEDGGPPWNEDKAWLDLLGAAMH